MSAPAAGSVLPQIRIPCERARKNNMPKGLPGSPAMVNIRRREGRSGGQKLGLASLSGATIEVQIGIRQNNPCQKKEQTYATVDVFLSLSRREEGGRRGRRGRRTANKQTNKTANKQKKPAKVLKLLRSEMPSRQKRRKNVGV